jgi:hypothetical protein
MTFDLKRAQKIRDGYFAVVDSIIEHYESEGSKMFPDAVKEIERLLSKNKQLEDELRHVRSIIANCPY